MSHLRWTLRITEYERRNVRTRGNRGWLGPVVMAILCVSAEAGAQTVWRSVKVGHDVMVVEDGGAPVKVRIAEIQSEKLVIIQDGRSREIPTARVIKIERGDSLRNGALIGFLVGTGFAVNRLGDCQMNCYGVYVPILGGIGAGIGTLADALRRRTTLYVVSDPAATAMSRSELVTNRLR